MKEMAHDEGWKFPVLYDESQDVARSLSGSMHAPIFFFSIKRQTLCTEVSLMAAALEMV